MCGMLNADSLLTAYQPGDLLETCIQRISGDVTILSRGIQLQPMASLSAQNLSAGDSALIFDSAGVERRNRYACHI